MKKAESNDELRPLYTREDFGKGIRGKHFEAYRKGTNLVLLSPDVAKVFPTDEAVNEALRSLINLARKSTGLKKRSPGQPSKKPRHSSATVKNVYRSPPPARAGVQGRPDRGRLRD